MIPQENLQKNNATEILKRIAKIEMEYVKKAAIAGYYKGRQEERETTSVTYAKVTKKKLKGN